MKAPLPHDEQQRRLALDRYRILDTVGEQAFDDLILLASHICRTPIAALTFVDADRQWIKSEIGADARELPRDVAFCSHAILSHETLVVSDALADERFRSNPLVTGSLGIRFYAGAPLVTPDGHALGALCVLDREARRLDSGQLEALGALARQAMAQLEMRRLVDVMHRGAAAREQAEEALRRSEASYKYLVDHADDIIYRTDAGGRFTFVNPSATRLLGLPETELLGRRFAELIDPEAREEAERFYLAQFADRISNTYRELPVRTGSDERRWIGQNVQLIIDGGRVTGFQAVARDITGRRETEARLHLLSLTDDLTGLYNRRALGALADEHAKLARRAGHDLIVVYTDMDGLKRINDRHGHDEGSRAIASAARVLRQSFRDSDSIARLGGDEFVVVGTAAREATPEQITARLRRNLHAYNRDRDHDYELSLSIGVARHDARDLPPLDRLVAAADEAMYADKRARRRAR